MKNKCDSTDKSSMKEELEAEIANLQQQIHRLQIARDALEKAAEFLKKLAVSLWFIWKTQKKPR